MEQVISRKWLRLTLVFGLFLGLLGPAHRLEAGPSSACPPIRNTPRFTIIYGTIQVGQKPAPIGTVVAAESPRGDLVGCFIVQETGSYGGMYVYGEDAAVNPAIPGMRTGEMVTLRINRAIAESAPILYWADDRDFHQIDIALPGLGWPIYLPVLTLQTPMAAGLSGVIASYDFDNPGERRPQTACELITRGIMFGRDAR